MEFFWLFITAIVFAGIIHESHKNHLKYKFRAQKFGQSDEKQELESLERIEKLEARVRVLERLATDKSRNLADEIDNLKGRNDTPLKREPN